MAVTKGRRPSRAVKGDASRFGSPHGLSPQNVRGTSLTLDALTPVLPTGGGLCVPRAPGISI
jgi:hypothetical protein